MRIGSLQKYLLIAFPFLAKNILNKQCTSSDIKYGFSRCSSIAQTRSGKEYILAYKFFVFSILFLSKWWWHIGCLW